jgi:hypothetical protein
MDPTVLFPAIAFFARLWNLRHHMRTSFKEPLRIASNTAKRFRLTTVEDQEHDLERRIVSRMLENMYYQNFICKSGEGSCSILKNIL